jgi:hypothetical protein
MSLSRHVSLDEKAQRVETASPRTSPHLICLNDLPTDCIGLLYYDNSIVSSFLLSFNNAAIYFGEIVMYKVRQNI